MADAAYIPTVVIPPPSASPPRLREYLSSTSGFTVNKVMSSLCGSFSLPMTRPSYVKHRYRWLTLDGTPHTHSPRTPSRRERSGSNIPEHRRDNNTVSQKGDRNYRRYSNSHVFTRKYWSAKFVVILGLYVQLSQHSYKLAAYGNLSIFFPDRSDHRSFSRERHYAIPDGVYWWGPRRLPLHRLF